MLAKVGHLNSSTIEDEIDWFLASAVSAIPPRIFYFIIKVGTCLSIPWFIILNARMRKLKQFAWGLDIAAVGKEFAKVEIGAFLDLFQHRAGD